jgi:hypothetical protein
VTGKSGAPASATAPEATPRSLWMTALAAFCAATVVFLIPRDLFLAETRDVEVWFGFELRGTAAIATAPLHWAIFGLGAWGFWQNRPWILPAAAAYVFYIALSHLIWSEVSPNGRGWATGLVQALALSLPGLLLLRLQRRSRESADRIGATPPQSSR